MKMKSVNPGDIMRDYKNGGFFELSRKVVVHPPTVMNAHPPKGGPAAGSLRSKKNIHRFSWFVCDQ